MNNRVPDKEIEIVGEICVLQDGYEVHTGTKMNLNLDVVKEIFEEDNQGFETLNDFIKDLFEKQLDPVIVNFTLPNPFIKIYSKIK